MMIGRISGRSEPIPESWTALGGSLMVHFRRRRTCNTGECNVQPFALDAGRKKRQKLTSSWSVNLPVHSGSAILYPSEPLQPKARSRNGFGSRWFFLGRPSKPPLR
ncbi:hypothetical protein PIB30_091886, partial [Stylosanthes scabra]|nr:hypothetical protein [Stylosanthes scabra]